MTNSQDNNKEWDDIEIRKYIDECIHCGETRGAIQKHQLFCATETNTEMGREVDQEWNRHRFKPYSKKELARMKSDEDEYIRQMGGFADFLNTQGL